MEFSIKNTSVYGLERAVKASGNPMRTVIDDSETTELDFKRARTLGNTKSGEGHDNYLKGILVHVDIIAPLYWWKEAQRYHWFDFVSSQSTMHSLMKFDVGTQVVDETDSRVVQVIRELIEEYNAIEDNTLKIAKWREIIASLPCGFCLGATMTTNYQQLKTMYRQRVHHKLVEWHEFCEWCLTLPMFDELTGVTKLKAY
jgi:hypothetical protein